MASETDIHGCTTKKVNGEEIINYLKTIQEQFQQTQEKLNEEIQKHKSTNNCLIEAKSNIDKQAEKINLQEIKIIEQAEEIRSQNDAISSQAEQIRLQAEKLNQLSSQVAALEKEKISSKNDALMILKIIGLAAAAALLIKYLKK